MGVLPTDSKKFLASYGESRQTHRDISIFQDSIGIICLKLEKIDEASEYYEASFETALSILTTYGESLENLRDLSISQTRVGDIFLTKQNKKKALFHYEKSLKVAKNILLTFGDSAESLRGVSILQNKIADIFLYQDKVNEANRLYHANLNSHKNILDSYGESAVRLKDLSVLQLKIGDLLSNQGDENAALHYHQMSLNTAKHLCSRFGQTAETLRALSVSQIKIGDNLFSMEDAFKAYNTGKDIHQHILDRYGENLERLNDLFSSHWKLSKCSNNTQDHLKHCRNILQKIISEYGYNSKRQRQMLDVEDRILEQEEVRKKTWEIFDGEIPDGRKFTVYYDHSSTLTVVPNYKDGQTLIFNDSLLNDPNLDGKAIVSCIVNNELLKEYTPAEIFDAACINSEKN